MSLLRAHLGPAPALESALDLGCGTGLCAPLLRPLVRRLAGVDLSEKMLDKAREAGLYDELACADIVDWLRQREAEWDLVLAADVLVYIGDLAPLFEGVARVLQPGGWFAFSVESLAPRSRSRSGRLRDHGIQPLRPCARLRARGAAAAGLALVETREAVLRKEHGADVAGMLFLAAVATDSDSAVIPTSPSRTGTAPRATMRSIARRPSPFSPRPPRASLPAR
jgi:predicted TPR repeat methyltransferase